MSWATRRWGPQQRLGHSRDGRLNQGQQISLLCGAIFVPSKSAHDLDQPIDVGLRRVERADQTHDHRRTRVPAIGAYIRLLDLSCQRLADLDKELIGLTWISQRHPRDRRQPRC